MIYFLAIQGYEAVLRTPRELQFEPEKPVVTETRAKEKEEDQEELEHWKERLQKYFDEKQPYLEPQLTLSELAPRLQTNTSVLSRAINAGFGQNFNDFINDFRVRAVREKLERGEARRLTLMSIALDCGFNSKATFNRAFRKHTGMSPREYLEKSEAGSEKSADR
jgi:AraC-like DNA-binding protein